jgi:hypothetical protein
MHVVGQYFCKQYSVPKSIKRSSFKRPTKSDLVKTAAQFRSRGINETVPENKGANRQWEKPRPPLLGDGRSKPTRTPEATIAVGADTAAIGSYTAAVTGATADNLFYNGQIREYGGVPGGGSLNCLPSDLPVPTL